jgi:hypothetical protein
MATACHKARAIAIKFVRAQIKIVDLFREVGKQLPEGGKLILEPVFKDMETVMVTTSRFHPEDSPEGFDSPEQLVDVVARVFGSGVESVIWSAWCQSGFAMSDVYWPHTVQLGELDLDV